MSYKGKKSNYNSLKAYFLERIRWAEGVIGDITKLAKDGLENGNHETALRTILYLAESYMKAHERRHNAKSG